MTACPAFPGSVSGGFPGRINSPNNSSSVEDIRGGASDWRASVWAGIDSATVMVFVLTPDSLASSVCGEELQRADELNKRKAAARLENWHRWRPA